MIETFSLNNSSSNLYLSSQETHLDLWYTITINVGQIENFQKKSFKRKECFKYH